MNLSWTLRVLPPRYEKQVREWLSVRSFTARDVRRRAWAAGALLGWWKETFRDAWVKSRVHDAIVALRQEPSVAPYQGALRIYIVATVITPRVQDRTC